MSDYSHLCGWVPGDGTIAATLPRFEETGLALAAPSVTPSGPILLYKAWKEVLSDYPHYPGQQIGDCVSFGHAHGNDLLQAIEIALGEPSVYSETDTEALYGAARSYNRPAFGDGTDGAAAVKAMQIIGMVSREMLGANGTYSGSRARQWGSRSGLPADVLQMCSQFKLGAACRIATWDQLVAAVWNAHPVTICSDQGFTEVRDQQGFCRAHGSWGHCMLIAGVRFDREGALICQSWGDVGHLSGPQDLDQPLFSFWAERKTVEYILSCQDSWALARAPEFKKRPIPQDWYRRAA
jgi:hypothetical protein